MFTAVVGDGIGDSTIHRDAFIAVINGAAFGDGTFTAVNGSGTGEIDVTFTPTGPSALNLAGTVAFTALTGTIGGMSLDLEDEVAGTNGSDLEATALAEFNTVFRFSGDTETDATWLITNFIAGGYIDANINNWTKLDLSDLGVTEDIGVNATVADWTGDNIADGLIVDADGYMFEIQLADVFDASFLTNDNLIFAS